jgi:hypothetical protein
MNPLAQHINFQQQVLQQYQLYEHYRQLQALHQLNSMPQLSLLQQPHLAAAAAQQQLFLDMYTRQARTAGLPTSAAAASWMVPQFADNKQHLLEAMSREQEQQMKAMDNKER